MTALLFLLTSTALAGLQDVGPLEACEAAGARQEVPAVGFAEGATEQPRVAVVVGIQCYQVEAEESLKYAQRDAELMTEVLHQRGYTVFQVVGSVDKQAVVRAIEEAGRALSPGGELVFYYAGHGRLHRHAGVLDRYLVTSDTKTLDEIPTTSISVSWLAGQLEDIPADHRTVIFDTCYASSGGRSWLPAHQPAEPSFTDRSLDSPVASRLGENDVWLYASDTYQRSREYQDLGGGHGLYTWYLAGALRDGSGDRDGDGYVNFMEAHSVAIQQTVARRGPEQVPQWDVGSRAPGRTARSSLATHAVLVLPAAKERLPVYLDGGEAALGTPDADSLIAVEPGAHSLVVCWDEEMEVSRRAACPNGPGVQVGKISLRLERGEWRSVEPLAQYSLSYMVDSKGPTVLLLAGSSVQLPDSALNGTPVAISAALWWWSRRIQPQKVAAGAELLYFPDSHDTAPTFTQFGGRVGWWWWTPATNSTIVLGPYCGGRLVSRSRDGRAAFGGTAVVGGHLHWSPYSRYSRLGLVVAVDLESLMYVADEEVSQRFRAHPAATLSVGVRR